jgi:hypothetical protein
VVKIRVVEPGYIIIQPNLHLLLLPGVQFVCYRGSIDIANFAIG